MMEVKKLKIFSCLSFAVLFVLWFAGINLSYATDLESANFGDSSFAQAAEEVEGGEVVEDDGSDGEEYNEVETYDDGGGYDDQGYEDQAYDDPGYDDKGYDDVGDENTGEVEDPNAVEELAEPDEAGEN